MLTLPVLVACFQDCCPRAMLAGYLKAKVSDNNNKPQGPVLRNHLIHSSYQMLIYPQTGNQLNLKKTSNYASNKSIQTTGSKVERFKK